MRMRANRKLTVCALTLVALLTPVAISSAIKHLPKYAGYQTGNKQVLVGFDLSGRGCPGPECFDHRAHVLEFGAVGYLYPDCPQLIWGGTELERPVLVGRNGSFEASGPGQIPGEKISFGGRFLHEGRLARGWVIVDNGGCLTERIRWTASRE
jgi:hypothetical protein